MTGAANLTDRELVTVLAALRLWQQGCSDPELQEIASEGGRFPPLTAAEIDELCETMNGGGLVFDPPSV